VARGSNNSTSVTATATSGTPAVGLGVSGLRKFTNANFSANPVAATGSSTLTISANKNASPGTYTVSVTGSDASGSQSAPLTLTIK
jgi:hypothetical protein